MSGLQHYPLLTVNNGFQRFPAPFPNSQIAPGAGEVSKWCKIDHFGQNYPNFFLGEC